jgi:predicted dithiol-disulfide oxidoreductase (DUF899 family)
MATEVRSTLPEIVSLDEWKAAREALLVKEKAHMKAADAISAERRRLPMVEITTPYTLQSPEGPVSLLDLFEGRSQLIVYHFMYDPAWDEGCVGCSMLVDHMGPDQHLHARDTTRVLVSRAPLDKIVAYKQRMGWDQKWVSSFGTSFNQDFEATTADGEDGLVSVFLHDGERIFRTNTITNRGTETFVSVFKYLDLTPFGRQEMWEDAPEGRPKSPEFWWKRHDEYEPTNKATSDCCH